MADLVSIPSVDDIAREPRRLAALDAATLAALMERCAAVISALAAENAGRVKAAQVQLAVPDRTLNADEIAAALGCNRRWVFRNAGRLPFVRRVSRKNVVGSEAGLRRWRESQKV